MRRIVSNTGPLLHLREAEVLDLLRLAGEVYIPHTVDTEIAYLWPDQPWQRPDWLTVASLTAASGAEASRWQHAGLVDPGEAEAIALARQLQATWFLTDDAGARLFAKSLGIEVHGSLGVVLWSAAVGHLSRQEAEAALDRLSQSSLWLSPAVLSDAKAALAKM